MIKLSLWIKSTLVVIILNKRSVLTLTSYRLASSSCFFFLLPGGNSPLPFPTRMGRRRFSPLVNFLRPVKFPIVDFQKASRNTKNYNWLAVMLVKFESAIRRYIKYNPKRNHRTLLSSHLGPLYIYFFAICIITHHKMIEITLLCTVIISLLGSHSPFC